jgi:hypothetical protein
MFLVIDIYGGLFERISRYKSLHTAQMYQRLFFCLEDDASDEDVRLAASCSENSCVIISESEIIQ